MSVIRMTDPPRWGGGVRGITPSGTGSSIPLFEAGAPVVIQRPARTRSPGATSAVGSLVSDRMHERPDAFTPVTIRRTFPGMSFPPLTWPGDHTPSATPLTRRHVRDGRATE